MTSIKNKNWSEILALIFIKWQNFGRDQIGSICRPQIDVAQMMISVLDRVENIVGKRENAG